MSTNFTNYVKIAKAILPHQQALLKAYLSVILRASQRKIMLETLSASFITSLTIYSIANRIHQNKKKSIITYVIILFFSAINLKLIATIIYYENAGPSSLDSGVSGALTVPIGITLSLACGAGLSAFSSTDLDA